MIRQTLCVAVLFGIAVASNAQPTLVPIQVTPVEVSIHPSSSDPVTGTNSATFGNLSVAISENFVELTGGPPLDPFERMTAVFEYVVPGPPGSTPLVVSRREQSALYNGTPVALSWSTDSKSFYHDYSSGYCGKDALGMVTSTMLGESVPALFDIMTIEPLDVVFSPAVAGDTIRWEVAVRSCSTLRHVSTFTIRLDIRTPSPAPPAAEVTAEEFDALATDVESIDTRLNTVESLRGIRDRLE